MARGGLSQLGAPDGKITKFQKKGLYSVTQIRGKSLMSQTP